MKDPDGFIGGFRRTIEEFSIVNSGIGYDSDPIVRVSHPQIERRADYFLTTHVYIAA